MLKYCLSITLLFRHVLQQMSTMAENKSKDWLIQNAILAYLHNYPSNTWTQQYKELLDELTNPPEVRKRGRPAQRQRKKKTSTSEAGKGET